MSFDYDDADRATLQTLADGRQIGFAHDAAGNLTTVIPPSRPNHASTFTPVDLTDTYPPPTVPGAGATHYEYNLDRQLTSVLRPDGKTIALGYDGAGRLDSIGIERGALTLSYDSGTGLMQSMATPEGDRIDLSYDGTLVSGASWTGTVTASVTFGYDADLRLSSESVDCATATTAACNAVVYQYDQDDLLTAVGALQLSRDPQNGLLQSTVAGAVRDSWIRNGFGEVTDYAAEASTEATVALFAVHDERDALGRVTDRTETILGETTTKSYHYDTAGRLDQVKTNDVVTATYTYDENGNRLTATDAEGPHSGTYDDQDRMLTYDDAAYTYTANGELQSRTDHTGTTTYLYDEPGNLLRVTKPNGDVIEYIIDAANRRIAKKINGAIVQRWIYTSQLGPSAELDASGNVVARYIYGTRVNVPDLIVRGDTTYRVITDSLGSPRLVIDVNTGEIAQRLDYDEFGNVFSDSDPGFQPFGFAGGLYDPDTGFGRFGARDYDPHAGRWTNKDPISFRGGGLNLYGYVFDDPVNLTDETGLTATCTYHQATGQLICVDDTSMTEIVNETGYSGKGVKKNDPASQCDKNEGPIPRGTYAIGTGYDTKTHGPQVLRLTEDAGNSMCGRSGFLIHGDSTAHPGEASEGCIIMGRPTRDAIDTAGGGTLTVVEQ